MQWLVVVHKLDCGRCCWFIPDSGIVQIWNGQEPPYHVCPENAMILSISFWLNNLGNDNMIDILSHLRCHPRCSTCKKFFHCKKYKFDCYSSCALDILSFFPQNVRNHLSLFITLHPLNSNSITNNKTVRCPYTETISRIT